jgi:hypothetical protein
MVALGWCWQVWAQVENTKYPKMAPLDEYLMERNAEIELARSAAPDSLSKEADVLVLGRKGYEAAVKGKNGFVCLVERSWTAGIDDPDFWSPKLRGPMCMNPAAARSVLPVTFKKTQWVLAGATKEQMFAKVKSAFDKNELKVPEHGAMCYMMSIHGYLGDANGHWHPHLMFFLPQKEAMDWGAGVPGSPVLVSQSPEERLTVFYIPVGKWSDGSVAPPTDDLK